MFREGRKWVGGKESSGKGTNGKFAEPGPPATRSSSPASPSPPPRSLPSPADATVSCCRAEKNKTLKSKCLKYIYTDVRVYFLNKKSVP